MKKILVAPLHWGLGHATRCIPVIRELLRQQAEVSIASDGGALNLLKQEFPQLRFFELPSYNISYSSGDGMIFKMIGNYPGIKKAIAQEHEALKEIVSGTNFDVIISDNRYGLWHEKTQNIFITHQINLQVPKHLKWLQPLLINYNLKQISNFDECWIPDVKGVENLSGDLSHNCKLPPYSYYIGVLSRFRGRDDVTPELRYTEQSRSIQTSSSISSIANCQLLIILSGPEPQRSIFEKIIVEQVKTVSQATLIVQGLTEKSEEKQLTENVWMISYLTSEALFKRIIEAELIVSRSGYSTIMDLTASGKKAVLVPTPGQTEQEYLAGLFFKKNIFYSASQNDFNLYDAIEKSKSFKGLHFKKDDKVLEERIKYLLC